MHFWKLLARLSRACWWYTQPDAQNRSGSMHTEAQARTYAYAPVRRPPMSTIHAVLHRAATHVCTGSAPITGTSSLHKRALAGGGRTHAHGHNTAGMLGWAMTHDDALCKTAHASATLSTGSCSPSITMPSQWGREVGGRSGRQRRTPLTHHRRTHTCCAPRLRHARPPSCGVASPAPATAAAASTAACLRAIAAAA